MKIEVARIKEDIHPAERIDLGDWDSHFSYLQADEQGFTLQRFPLSALG